MPSGEDQLIARYFKPIATAAGALGLTDDAACYAPPVGQDLVLTSDAVVAGIHFLPDDPAASIAQKALRVNLSDLAAKGAVPAGCLLTLALPRGTAEGWLHDFAAGLKSDCDAFQCPLFGGDTVRTEGPLWASIAALGVVPQGTMVKRSGAKPGDRIFITGTIGDAALGLIAQRETHRSAVRALSERDRATLIERYRIPRPRLAMAAAVRASASAAMDISDGLVGDLAKLCAMSGVSARIAAAAIPLSAAARAALDADSGLIEPIATGGDDYEILAAVPAERAAAFRDHARVADVAVTEIGEIVEGGEPPRIVGADGKPLVFARGSFSHF